MKLLLVEQCKNSMFLPLVQRFFTYCKNVLFILEGHVLYKARKMFLFSEDQVVLSIFFGSS